jgi:hypothetical protein
VVSFDRSLFEADGLRLKADFNHPLSHERPFNFLLNLGGPLGIDNITAMSAMNIHSTIKLKQTRKWMETKTDMETETETYNIWTWTRTRTWHGIRELLLSITYGAIVPIGPYGSLHNFQCRYILVAPLHYGNNDNSYCCWNSSPNDVLAKVEISVWG